MVSVKLLSLNCVREFIPKNSGGRGGGRVAAPLFNLKGESFVGPIALTGLFLEKGIDATRFSNGINFRPKS